MPEPRSAIRVGAACGAVALLLISHAFAGPPFRTDDPEPVPYRHFEITFLSFGTKAAGGWAGTLPGLEVNYGALPELQLHALLPLDYSSPRGGRTGFAFGDLELGAKYRFLSASDEDWFPDAAIFPAIEVPAGNQQFGFSTGHAAVFLPVWLQKDVDPWTIYGGGGYWINPGAGNKNYTFFGTALWRKLTDPLSVGIEVFHQTPAAANAREGTGFNVGGIYDFSESWHLLASAGSGIQNRNATNQFSYYLGLQLTF